MSFINDVSFLLLFCNSSNLCDVRLLNIEAILSHINGFTAVYVLFCSNNYLLTACS
nr:MAG TPA: hypothetical protein [Crassvirales sp.]